MGTQIIQDEDWLTNANSLTNIHDPHRLLSKISRAPCRAVAQSAQNVIAAAGLNRSKGRKYLIFEEHEIAIDTSKTIFIIKI